MADKFLRHNAIWIPARFKGEGRLGSPVTLIVLHTTENNETANMAVNVGNYFKNQTQATSAHYIVDNKVVVQSVDEEDRAWAAPPANTRGIHVELVGRAGQTKSQWNDPYSKAMLKIAATLVGELFVKYPNIPVRQLSVDTVKRGWAGICGHVDVSKAFKQSDHTDPGIYFPWGSFMGEVRNYVALNGK